MGAVRCRPDSGIPFVYFFLCSGLAAPVDYFVSTGGWPQLLGALADIFFYIDADVPKQLSEFQSLQARL